MLAELMNRLEDIAMCLRHIKCRELLDEQPCPELIGKVIADIEELIGRE